MRYLISVCTLSLSLATGTATAEQTFHIKSPDIQSNQMLKSSQVY